MYSIYYNIVISIYKTVVELIIINRIGAAVEFVTLKREYIIVMGYDFEESIKKQDCYTSTTNNYDTDW